jgi:hypothetical protein
VLAACAGTFACRGDADGGAFTDHDEGADFAPFDSAKADGVSEYFTPDFIVDDALFGAFTAVDAAAVQTFLETTPYGTRSFLADASVGGQPAADAIVAAGVAHQINPLVLLVRLQVESSLVGKTSAPDPSSFDFAFGCGCADGQACNEAYRGFDRQLDCAASTLREQYDAAGTEAGAWRVGVPGVTEDDITVTPQNQATAALYAYTPWVLEGKGGNWLVWNVTGRYLAAFADAGTPLDPNGPGDVIGAKCEPGEDTACGFSADGADGFCLEYSEGDATYGMCSLPCEGLCPDQPGVETLCVEVYTDLGSCLPIAGPGNADCVAIEGTLAIEADRFVGGSAAGPRTETVCFPSAVGDPEPAGASCVGYCGTGTAIPDGNGNACFCDVTCIPQGDCCDDYTTVCG